MEALRVILDPWLGKPQWKQTEGRVTFVYRFNSEDTPPIPLRHRLVNELPGFNPENFCDGTLESFHFPARLRPDNGSLPFLRGQFSKVSREQVPGFRHVPPRRTSHP